MWPCLSNTYNVNADKAGKATAFVSFDREGTCVEHGNTQLSFSRFRWDWWLGFR